MRFAFAKDEGGFAVPTVMLIMVAALGIASAAAVFSLAAQRGTARDQQSKSAFSVAESGISDAMLRFNLTDATGNSCAPVSSQGPGGGGWCPQRGPTNSVDGGSFTYWVHPPSVTPSSRCVAVSAEPAACLEIASVGTLDGVTRRVDVTATSASNRPMFADAAVKAQNAIVMDSNSEVHSSTATNGDITLSSNAKQCGGLTVGVGHQVHSGGSGGLYSDQNCQQATQTFGQAPLTLPPVNQGDAPAHNDNLRFFSLDPVSGNKADACFNGVKGDGSAGSCGARGLSVGNNGSVTLAGAIYSFCRLTLHQNSKLYISAGSNTTIYFDTPEACGYSSGAVQLQLDSNTRISTATTAPTSLALLFVGSSTRATTIQLNSNTDANAVCQQNFVLYAPLSDIDMNSNSTYCGALAGKTIHLDSNAELWAGSQTGSFVLPNTAAYYVIDPNGYVECSVPASSPPNAGC